MPRALLIYDRADAVERLGGLLKADGWQVTAAPKDIRQAGELGRHETELMLLDVAGPLSQALPFLRAFGAARGQRRRLVILATELTTADVRKARLMGVSCCLCKPISRQALVSAVSAA